MSQALYRRYRPETFADVIGQEHVTEPLMQALRSDRVSHAYLFSGPRGCGKTTSARILARCLNCETGPTPTPCGACDSCVGLARGGAGTIDVIEIDAASHGGVDDARELRDKAFFSPASSRFKIYIIDEAHMVSPAGFNALLKVVEEPPAHLKFIFATTEPDKVISTIRSRTHHYPFRLIPPGRLQEYLATLCEREGVTVAKGVLPLVVRAGRGSARDSLSVLDQLMAGAGESGVTYALATALLGFTDATLLDDTIDAIAAGDGAAVFGVVEQVIEAGHDPRRFADDLLERFRDLIVLAAVPDAVAALLGELPPDQLERMRGQAARLGPAELSRAADIVDAGLVEMKGTTSPRLQLELMCARILLPAATDDDRSLLARLERLERRMTAGSGMPAPTLDVATPAPPPAVPAPSPEVAAGSGSGAASAPPDDTASSPAAAGTTAEDQRGSRAQQASTASEVAGGPAPAAGAEPASGALDLVAVRRMWPDVLSQLASLKRSSWTLVSQDAQVIALESRMLTLGFSSAGLRDRFADGAHPEFLRQALIDVLGVDWTVEAIVDLSGSGGQPTPAPAATFAPAARRGAARPRPAAAPAPTATTTGDPPVPAAEPLPADEPSANDVDLDDGVTGAALVERMLGAKVIGEFDTP